MKVTDRAKEHLKQSLDSVKSSPKSDSCFRIVKDGKAFRVEVDVPAGSDKTFEAEGETVLAVEPEVVDQCQGMTLDLDTSKGSAELVFIPNLPD